MNKNNETICEAKEFDKRNDFKWADVFKLMTMSEAKEIAWDNASSERIKKIMLNTGYPFPNEVRQWLEEKF